MNLNLTNRLFYALGVLAVVFAAGFFLDPILYVAWGLLLMVLLLFCVDAVLLFAVRHPFMVERNTGKLWSLSDHNRVRILIRNKSGFRYRITVLDELPEQLQIRDFEFRLSMGSRSVKSLDYEVRPLTRGQYLYGKVLVYASGRIGLASRRHSFSLEQKVPVYPSVIQMHRYELRSMERLSSYHGVKKLRRIGHSYEFETIRNYVAGDDYRAVNWKATGRRSQLMVNQYEDEKSQQIYAVIDKSRPMMLSFNGVTLMDYAINASLVMANCSLQKHDKAGLVTFSDRMGSMIRAENGRYQLKKILETLYAERGRQTEADFELLYQALTRLIPGRSMVFLYTNFESVFALQRILPILRKINHHHLLLVVNFENTELADFTQKIAENVEEVYLKTLARQMLTEKQQMAVLMGHHGIQTILSRPEELSVNSVNKYLELKARGLI